MRTTRFILSVVLAAALSCAPQVHEPFEQPGCLYEVVTVDGDAGQRERSFVIQHFASLAECRAYERLCNAQAWPLSRAARCTECCTTCGL